MPNGKNMKWVGRKRSKRECRLGSAYCVGTEVGRMTGERILSKSGLTV